MKKVLVKNSKGKKLVVQDTMIPPGYRYVEEYKEQPKKQTKSEK